MRLVTNVANADGALTAKHQLGYAVLFDPVVRNIVAFT
jgi:hypothetical protein